MESKIIERTKQNLNFIEQLQEQIGLCREALSRDDIPLTLRVDTLEALLWAKLNRDKEYQQRIKELKEWFKEKTKDLDLREVKNERKAINSKRYKAREKFKAIMIFIDKKNLMPIGEEENG